MSQPTDPTFEFIRSGHQAALRVLILMEEARQATLKLQVKALEDDIKGARRILAAMSEAPDWNTFHGMPTKLLAEQVERNADFARAAGKLSIELGTGLFEQFRAGTEQWAELQRNALSAGSGYVPPLAESVKGMFDNVSQAMMWPGLKTADPAAATTTTTTGS